MAKKNKHVYSDDSIISLSPRDFTRLRPSTYLGSNEYSTQLVRESFANALDEHVIGHGDKIEIVVDTNKNKYSVKDYGQGFPINSIREDNTTVLEAAFSILNTSGKYDDSQDGIYQGSSLGCNGIGSKLICFLSKSLDVLTYNNNQFEHIWFKDGVFIKRETGEWKHKDTSGTIVTWSPDKQFFQNVEANNNDLKTLFESVSALCPQLTIEYTYDNNKFIYHSENGLEDLLDAKVKNKEILSNRFAIRKESDSGMFDIILTYTTDYSDNIIAYVNYGLTEAGVHISTVRSLITKQINKYAFDNNLLKKNDDPLTGAELSEGLVIAFNIKATNVKYDSQTKTKVVDIDKTLINAVLNYDFADWLMYNPKDVKLIVDRALMARKTKEAAQNAKELVRGLKVKSNVRNLDLPTKLIDANPRSKDRSNCILYCVEGDSAANGLISKRNGEIHGIMPLRGKILSARKASIEDLMKNQEIQNIIKAIGLDLDPDTFTLKYNIKKLRFSKIVFLCDGDPDGGHIRLLLLTLFWRLCPELITNGHIYSSCPPLYKITTKKNEYLYLTAAPDLEAYKAKHKSESFIVNRLKGLGEMSPSELYECMIKDGNKNIMQITVDDFDNADNELEIFMGNEVTQRRDYYNKHYNDISIDIE